MLQLFMQQNGLDVTLVEAGKLGGTCLNVGVFLQKHWLSLPKYVRGK